MTTNDRPRRTRRGLATAAALGVVVSTGVSIGVTTPFASAALGGLTQFEIDGNVAVDGAQDWASDPNLATNLNDPAFETSEACENNPGIDPDTGDELFDDPNRVVQGSKIDDIDIAAPPINSGNVPRKTDLCSVYRTWEIVFVPDVGNPDPAAGQYQFIFYGAWSRPNVNGEIDVLFPLLGGDDASKTDDVIISYDFVDSSDTTTVEILKWDGATWAPIALDPAWFEATTTRGVELHAVTDAPLTFGEFAINLTLAGILPENGPCVSLSAGDPMSRTGNSSNSTLEDIVDAAPVTLTNCGSLTVTKETVPAVPAGEAAFDITVDELDGAIIQFDGITQITDTLEVPTSPSETYTDMLISPDYQVIETNLPEGWTQQSVVCTSYDPIAGADVTRTLYSNGASGPDSSFPIAPGVEAACTIVNDGPPTVTVQKTTIGGAGGPFGFTVTDAEGDTPLSATTAQADTPTTVDEGTIEVAPGSVTVVESALAAGFYAGDLTCTVTYADGSSADFNGLATADGSPTGATFDMASGDTAACIQENLAAGSLEVTKQVDPPEATGWSFDFTISPVPAGETATKAATAEAPTVSWGNLQPGVSYSVTETGVDGFITGELTCVDGQNGTGTSTVAAVAGATIACTAANTELANVDVTKTVDGVSTDWAFDFTIDPVPEGETATKTATPDASTVSWIGLVPGTEYTITETDVDGYITGVLTCGGTDSEGTSTFAPTAGQDVTCTITNTELANVEVTKTVDGVSTDWAFDFTISPIPAGEVNTKTATADAPTISWDGLVPGTEYTITETDVDGYITGVLTCGGTDSEGTSTFAPTAGQDVTCTITNTELANVEVTKTVEPAETGWSYDFTISPIPDGEDATKSATSDAPTVSWDGLVPGTEYTITELVTSDLVIGTLTCTDGDNAAGTSTFTPGAGEAVTCSITNTRVADIEVVKTAGADSVITGGPLAWQIQVSNNGPSTALDVVLTDELPVGLTLISVEAPDAWDCSASVTGSPGVVTCTKPDMLPGETWAFTINTTVTGVAPGASFTNVAVVTTTTTETTTDNNTDSASSRVEEVVILPPLGGYVQVWLIVATSMILAGAAMLIQLERRRRVS